MSGGAVAGVCNMKAVEREVEVRMGQQTGHLCRPVCPLRLKTIQVSVRVWGKGFQDFRP